MIAVLFLLTNNAEAATVFPSVIDVSVDSGFKQTSEVVIKNTDVVAHEYDIDIIGVELGSGEGEYIFYDLENEVNDWFSISNSQFELIPQEERVVNVEINPSANTKPQILIVGLRIIEKSTSEEQIMVNSGVVSLLFITISGDELQGDYDLIDFSSDCHWMNGNITTYITLKNTGDKIIQPVGEVVYRNIFGLKSKVDINPEANRVAEEQIRTFSVSNQIAWGFGPYFVSTDISPWEGEEIMADSHIVWIFSIRSLVLILVLVGIIMLTWRYVKRR
jgi:hypothetical protein